MYEDANNDKDRPALDELEGALRRAVDHVRTAPPPPNVLNRALDRALRLESPTTPRLTDRRRFLWTRAAVAAVLLLGVALTIYNVWRRQEGPAGVARHEDPAGERLAPDHLRARPRADAPAAKPLAIGETLRTHSGQRRRATLADGSVLYVNQNSEVTVAAARQLRLRRGEVFIEAAPRSAESEAFVVRTTNREVAALGTKFAVRSADAGTGVVVTQGRVKVSGLEDVVRAGQQLAPGAAELTPAPRASYLLDWTRELMASAESPLVPASNYCGGALVAVDPSGQEAKLALRKYHIDVHIEDGFARTTIDQTYFNHSPWRMEGTFYFPLPPEASLSRLAMYVSDGKECVLMEGGMAERDYARQVFEQIMHTQRDPALLEWLDGSTFKMRVFPLEGRQEKRIILSYTQRLASAYGRTSYRFPAGHNLDVVGAWSFHARVKNGAPLVWSSPSHTLKGKVEGADLVLDAAAEAIKIDRDVALDLHDPSGAAPADVARFSCAEHEGCRYLMLRYRPNLPTQTQRQRRDWVILFESPGDRDPLLARTQIEVIRSLLANAEHDDTFVVLSAGTYVRAFSPEALPATAANIEAAMKFLDRAHLVGALDLGAALSTATTYLQTAQDPHLVHVGSGIAALGQRRAEELVKRLPAGTRYVGVGVGKRWSRSFMKLAAERTGGYFTQINPDEPVAWRGFELAATLNTPRLLDLAVTDPAKRATFLTYAGSLAQGEEACAIARLAPEATDLPATVTITGKLDGQPFYRDVPVQEVADHADYLPRTWARLEIDRLLADGAAKNKKQIIDLSKAMYVMTPFTSLLVLENEAMYKQFNVDRGRKDHWAMYDCPATMPIVFEPDPLLPVDLRNAPQTARPLRNIIQKTILVRSPIRALTWPNHSEQPLSSRSALTNLSLGDLGFLVSDADPLGVDVFAWSPDGRTLMSAGNDPTVSLWDATTGITDLRRKSSVNESARQPGRVLSKPLLAERLMRVSEQRAAWGLQLPALHNPSGGAMRGDHRFQSWSEAMQVGREWHYREPGLASFNGFLSAGDVLRDGRLEYLMEEEKTLEGLSLAPAPASAFLTEADRFVHELLGGHAGSPRLHGRPSFSHDERLFSDLLAHAPGMATSPADLQAVLESEAEPELRMLPGRIEPAARKLIERARASGWQTLVLRDWQVVFDGSGRYAYERTLPLGLHERVVCDGQTLWHLYPELGIGGRRSVSRFHRAELAEAVPWLVAPVEDLARGAHVRCLDDRTVAIVPHDKENAKDAEGKPVPYLTMQLRFGADGRLTERRVLQMPDGKTLSRETYAADGTVERWDADGKETAVRSVKVRPAQEPDLRPNTRRLVVLSLPLRTRDHVYRTLGLDPNQSLHVGENACFEYLDADAALTLLAAEVASRNADAAQQVFRKCFATAPRLPGFYTLLAAAGVDVTGDPAFLALLAEDSRDPLIGYLALLHNPIYRAVQQRWDTGAGARLGVPNSFLHRLAEFHGLYLQWRDGSARRNQAQQERALDFVRCNKSNVLGWAMLCLLQERAGKDAAFYRAIADAWRVLSEAAPDMATARYEHALNLLNAGQRREARELFRTLYRQALRDGRLLPIDGAFRRALQSDGQDADLWSELMQQAADELMARKRLPLVVTVAWQCWQLDDQPLAASLLAAALARATTDEERLQTTLSGIAYLWQTRQFVQADKLVQALLGHDRFAQRPSLHRLASRLAERRGMTPRSIAHLEKALDLEYQRLPAVIDLRSLRSDYGKLLDHYQWLATAAATLHMPEPADLRARVVRAADRWRALDREADTPCQAAARTLQVLGARELAWEYLTTPIARHPEEAAPWLGMAHSLSEEGELELADLAYGAAFAAEPTNAQILWDRAQNLRQAGKLEEARKVVQQLAEGDWQPRFRWLQSQAEWQIRGR